MTQRLIGYVFLIAALVIGATVIYLNSQKSQVPLVYAPAQVLQATWLQYKNEYVEAGTYRTIDTSRDDVTTSEGQSYTMLRAVWLGDKTTFDGAWAWTQANLYHTDDHLFAWIWGKEPDGSYGVLTAQGGETTATDADEDIATSLIFAYARWQDPKYLTAAQGIISDIWSKEVITINGTPYLAADDVEKTSGAATIAVDPSYLSPAEYKLFAKVDPSDNWNALATSSYTLLAQTMQAPLDKSSSDGLPPDWVLVNRTTGALSAPTSSSTDTNFGFDAFRTPWRIALDWEWNQDPRAKALLEQMSFLQTQWQQNGKLASTYAHDGSVVTAAEDPAMYGGTIGYFIVADPSDAQSVYDNKLVYLYDPGTNMWKQPLDYYDDNWAWFGIALYNNLLPNLAAKLPASAYTQTSSS